MSANRQERSRKCGTKALVPGLHKHTLEETAEYVSRKLGKRLSAGRVWQIEVAALKKIRSALINELNGKRSASP